MLIKKYEQAGSSTPCNGTVVQPQFMRAYLLLTHSSARALDESCQTKFSSTLPYLNALRLRSNHGVGRSTYLHVATRRTSYALLRFVFCVDACFESRTCPNDF